MTSLDHLREIFHAIAGVLVWPVLAGLLGLIAAMLVACGTFVREAWDRRAGQRFSLARDRAALDTAARLAPREHLELQLEEILQAAERRRWRAEIERRFTPREGQVRKRRVGDGRVATMPPWTSTPTRPTSR